MDLRLLNDERITKLIEQTDTLEPSSYAALAVAIVEGLAFLMFIIAHRARTQTRTLSVPPSPAPARLVRRAGRHIP